MISAAFARLLRDGRNDLNTRFQTARHRYPDLDAARFRRFLEEAVDPLVSGMAAVTPAAIPDLLNASYDVALDLCGQRLVGSEARYPEMNALWRELLPVSLPLLAPAPSRVLVALGNAIHQLATTPGARPGEWLDLMAAMASRTSDTPTWLQLGQVAAWRCGLSHYRTSALRLADRLPGPLVAHILGAEGRSWPELRQALSTDPWWAPAGHPRLEEVTRFGGFSGLGGIFQSLPAVSACEDQLFVFSGPDCWLVIADRFGITLHRTTPAERQVVVDGSRVDIRSNLVTLQGKKRSFDDISRISSHAATEHTLLLCSPDSYQVIVVALSGSL